MNRHDLEKAARALESSGYRFYRATSSDGANLRSYEPVDWQPAIGRLINATGWAIGPEVEETVRPELRLVADFHVGRQTPDGPTRRGERMRDEHGRLRGFWKPFGWGFWLPMYVAAIGVLLMLLAMWVGR